MAEANKRKRSGGSTARKALHEQLRRIMGELAADDVQRVRAAIQAPGGRATLRKLLSGFGQQQPGAVAFLCDALPDAPTRAARNRGAALPWLQAAVGLIVGRMLGRLLQADLAAVLGEPTAAGELAAALRTFYGLDAAGRQAAAEQCQYPATRRRRPLRPAQAAELSRQVAAIVAGLPTADLRRMHAALRTMPEATRLWRVLREFATSNAAGRAGLVERLTDAGRPMARSA